MGPTPGRSASVVGVSNRATSGRLAPGLLLAAPRLGDPNFERTVVLLGRHDDEGAMGWILNGRALGRVRDLLRVSSANDLLLTLAPGPTALDSEIEKQLIDMRGQPVSCEAQLYDSRGLVTQYQDARKQVRTVLEPAITVSPTATLLVPVVLPYMARTPIAVLDHPVVLENKVLLPTPVLEFAPVAILNNTLSPTATVLFTE